MGSELGYRSRVVPDSSSVTFDDGMNHASAGWLMSNDRQSVFAEEKSPGADAFGIGTSFAKCTPIAANGLSVVVSTTMGRFAIHMARHFLQQDVGYS